MRYIPLHSISTRWSFVGITIFLFLLFSSCGESSNHIQIGVYGPFSGGSAPMGISMKNGAALAVQEINKAGGLLGKQITLIERDDEAKNERGGQVVQEMINQEKVQAIFGPANTGVADASTRYSQEAKIPHIITVSAGAKVNELFQQYPDNYVFRIAANDLVQSELIVKEAIVIKKYKRPALLCDETNYGQGGRAKMEAALAKINSTPVYIGKFKLKDVDMTAQLQDARSKNADVLLVYGIGPELSSIANNLEKIGWKVEMIGSWTLSMANFIDNAAQNGNGVMMPQTFIVKGAKKEKEISFVNQYLSTFKVDKISCAVAAAQAYDAVYLYKLAVEQAGTTEGSKVKAALENLQKTYEGVLHTFDHPFSPTNHEAIDVTKVKMGKVWNGEVIYAHEN